MSTFTKSSNKNFPLYSVKKYFTDLPSPSVAKEQVYIVLNSSGIWPFTRYSKGFYYSDGIEWSWLGDIPVTLSDLTGSISDIQHGSQTNQNLHSLATENSYGFMSSEDKKKLDSFTYDEQLFCYLINN